MGSEGCGTDPKANVCCKKKTREGVGKNSSYFGNLLSRNRVLHSTL